MDRFELQGATYYQQGRKCGNQACQCASGNFHGPYWYKRDHKTGKVKYLGKDLPENVTKARAALSKLQSSIKGARFILEDEIKKLVREKDALDRLYNGQPIQQRDVEIIKAFDFGDCLV